MKNLVLLFAFLASAASFADTITLSPGATMTIFARQNWTITCDGSGPNTPTGPNIINCQCAQRTFGAGYSSMHAVGMIMNQDGTTHEVSLGKFDSASLCNAAIARMAVCPQ